MSKRRWVRIDCDYYLDEDEIFPEEPFTQREAYQWLIMNAAWKDTSHTIGNKEYPVLRGAQYRTIRKLCKEWQWGNTKVRNFLEKLERKHKITTESNTGKTLITLCNYSKFQDRNTESNTQTTHPQHTDNTETTQEQHTKGTNNTNNTNNNLTPLSPSKPKGEQSKPSSRGTRLSAEWVPSEDDFQFGLDLGFDPSAVRFMADSFKDYWIGASGAKAVKKDWPATWRNWARRKYEDGQKKPNQQPQRQAKVSEMDILDSFKSNQGTFQ